MKEILFYLRTYLQESNKKVFILTTLVVVALIILNYTIGIERAIKSSPAPLVRLLSFFFLYSFIFTISYAIHFVITGKNVHYKKQFIFLLLVCPLLFAVKISLDLTAFVPSSENDPWVRYYKLVANWPLKCLLITIVINTIWRLNGYSKPVAGMNSNFNWKPYVLLLLCVTPLLAFAANMDQFQNTYPKVKNIDFILPYTANDPLVKFLYEMSYGTDFFTIESFFRGFVVLAFVRYVGKDAILPMAAFYCTIHFGKPLFECITSYIGGIILGVIVLNTRSIWGGLIVHLGMAWLLEVLTLIFAKMSAN